MPDGVGFDVGDLVARLRIEASGFESGLQEAGHNLKGFAEEIAKSFGMSAEEAALLTESLSGVVVGIAAVESASWAAAAAAAAWGENLKDLAAYTGMSTQGLERLKGITIGTSADFDALTMNVTFFQKTLGRADKDSDAVIQALHKIGVNAKDSSGHLRNMDELFPEVIAKLSQVENPAERAGLAMAMFGRSSQNVLELAANSPEQLQKLSNATKVHGDATLNQAEAFKIKMDVLQNRFDVLWREVGLKLIPVMEEDLIPMFNAVADALTYLSPVLEYAARGFHILGMTLVSVGDMFVSLLMSIQALMAGDLDAASKAMNESFKRTADSFLAYRDKWQADWNEQGAAQLSINNQVTKSNYDQAKSAEVLGNEYKLAKDKVTELTDKLKDLQQFGQEDAEIARKRSKYSLDDAKAEFEAKEKIYNQSMAVHSLAEIPVAYQAVTPFAGSGMDEAEYIQKFKESAFRAYDEAQMKVTEAQNNLEKAIIKVADVKKDIETTKADLVKGGADMVAIQAKVTSAILEQSAATIGATKANIAAKTEEAKTTEALLAKEVKTTQAVYLERETMDNLHWNTLMSTMTAAIAKMKTEWTGYVDWLKTNPAIQNIATVYWDNGVPNWNPASNPAFASVGSIAVPAAATKMPTATTPAGSSEDYYPPETQSEPSVVINQTNNINVPNPPSPSDIVKEQNIQMGMIGAQFGLSGVSMF